MITAKSPPRRGVAWSTGKERVAVNRIGVPSRANETLPGVWPGCGSCEAPGGRPGAPCRLEHVVVAGQQRASSRPPRRRCRRRDLFDGPDVVPVSVRLEHRGHAQVVATARDDRARWPHRSASPRRPSTAHHVDLLATGPRRTVHLGVGVRPDQFDVVHLPQCTSGRRRSLLFSLCWHYLPVGRRGSR